MWRPPRLGCDCLSNSCRPGVTKRFGPRPEFATARPLEGRIPCDLHMTSSSQFCCIAVHSRKCGTWKKNVQCIWRAGLNWSGGWMGPRAVVLPPPLMETVKRSGDSTHHCRSPTPTVNGRDFILPTRTQNSEQEYNDLTASNRRSSTPYSTTLPRSFHEELGRMLSQGRQNMYKGFWLTPKISQKFTREWNLGLWRYGQDEIRAGSHSALVQKIPEKYRGPHKTPLRAACLRPLV